MSIPFFHKWGTQRELSQYLSCHLWKKKQAHRYVVLNCPYVKPFIDDFKDFVRRRSKGRRPSNVEIEKRVNKDFVTWFPAQLMNPDIMNIVHEDLRYLARGPSRYAKRFSTFSINGFSFRTTNRDKGLKTQNSGVFLMSSTPCVASASDADVRNADLSYYAKLEDIIELNYNGQFRVTLFKCKWADTTRERGCRKDNWGFTSVNFSRVIHSGLLVKDVHNLPEGLRIVVNFDRQHAAIGEAAGLLAGICGQLATDCVAFPISFDKWSDIPESFFENQWNIFFQARFCFKVCDSLAKRFLLQSLGKKWREHRIKLWNEFYDPRLSKTEIINNTPEDIALDQWALFVEYRLKPETQNLCKRNQEIRQKQIIPHTSGAKSIARRRAELTEETGKEVSRVQMWDITHKKIDGSYVNEKAKEIAEKIEAYSSQ
nr:uncharacterized protein LOC112784558 isoform X2 [Arachis hypogaea]